MWTYWFYESVVLSSLLLYECSITNVYEILSRPAYFLKITIVCNISMHVSVCVCAHVCACVRILCCVCMCVCMRTCTRVYVYVASYAYHVLKRGAGLGYSIVFAVPGIYLLEYQLVYDITLYSLEHN